MSILFVKYTKTTKEAYAMEPYVMAFDVGTSGVKTAVIAAE